MTYFVLLTVDDLTCSDLIMYSGAHNASAPATNATHVNPADDSMKLLLQTNTIATSICSKVNIDLHIALWW